MNGVCVHDETKVTLSCNSDHLEVTLDKCLFFKDNTPLTHDIYYHVNGLGVKRGNEGCPVGWTPYMSSGDHMCCSNTPTSVPSCTGSTMYQWPYYNELDATNQYVSPIQSDRCDQQYPWAYSDGTKCCSIPWEDTVGGTPLTYSSTTCADSIFCATDCQDWGYVANSFRVNPNQDTTTFSVTIDDLVNGVFAVSSDPNIYADTDHLNIGMVIQVTEDANILSQDITGVSNGYVSLFSMFA